MRETVESFRERTSRAATMLQGMIRRLVTSVTDGALWQVLGYTNFDGKRESYGAELFQHVGFASRPAGAAEVVVVNVGGAAEHPIIVATRDRSTAVALEADETAIYTSTGIVKVTKDGDVIVRAKAGRTVSVDDGSGAAELATKADLDALAHYVDHVLTLPVSGGTAGPTAGTTAPAAAGTSVLRGK